MKGDYTYRSSNRIKGLMNRLNYLVKNKKAFYMYKDLNFSVLGIPKTKAIYVIHSNKNGRVYKVKRSYDYDN